MRVYDVYWFDPASKALAIGAALHRKNTIDRRRAPRAIILWPSFFCPAVVFPDAGDGAFELLLATPDSMEITASHVNAQLKISRGLTYEKPIRSEPLFGGEDVAQMIEVHSVIPEDDVLSTHGNSAGEATRTAFRGRLHTPTLDLWFGAVGRKALNYFAVRIKDLSVLSAKSASRSGGTYEELQDAKIKRAFRELIPDGGLLRFDPAKARETRPCCHTVTDDHVHTELPDVAKPILAHHPIFVVDGDTHLGRLAHVTDLHVNSRQEILRWSDARVVPGADPLAKRDESATELGDLAPSLGEKVHVFGRHISRLIAAARAQGAQALVIGGDLVDHAHNAAPRPPHDTPSSCAAIPETQPRTRRAGAVWERVSMEGNYDKNYDCGVDVVSVYSLFRALYDDGGGLPMFGVTGNHDAYSHAYGISPRVGSRHKFANEGIPADHNLTIAEAVLLFGNSFAAVEQKFNFDAPIMRWYHALFCPFVDFLVEHPRNNVVGLGWGEAERMINADPTETGQGFGLLPRAKTRMDSVQLGLLQMSLGDANKSALVITHFTFASFDGAIPEVSEGEPSHGTIRARWYFAAQPYTNHDQGTFESCRADAYTALFDKHRKVALVLTGHSHRKSLYMLSRTSRDDRDTVATMFGTHQERKLWRSPESFPVLLSDSCGPVPRSNERGEFGGWGSDEPSLSLITLNSDCAVESVKPIRTGWMRAKPRAAVAIDYLHFSPETLLKFSRAFVDDDLLQCHLVDQSSPEQSFRYCWVPTRRLLQDFGISVNAITLIGESDGEWSQWRPRRVALPDPMWPNGEQIVAESGAAAVHCPVWTFTDAQARTLNERWRGAGRRRYIGLQFSCTDATLAARYNWDDWWFAEAAVRSRTTSNYFGFRIQSNNAAVIDGPDYTWLRTQLPETYGSPGA